MSIVPHFVGKPWGGQFISKIFNLPSQKLGEAFLVSTLEGNESQIDNYNLSFHINSKLPYLIKVIDAEDNLSIQVHPNDYWAGKLENSKGKTECWYVIDADEGAGVYYGLKENITFDLLVTAIKNNQDVSELLNFYQVKPGDFISVPAGTIHAIGRGVRILEFQQSSGLTYRIWDWNRDGRALHLDEARKVIVQNAKMDRIIAFDDIEVDSEFFIHDDFVLKKKSETSIECYSLKADNRFLVNVRSLSCEFV